MRRPFAIRIHEADNVAVAVQSLAAGTQLDLTDAAPVVLFEDVAPGHKIAVADLERTNNERSGNREISIWKSGVTL